MIEEIFRRSAHGAVIVRCRQDNHIRLVDSALQLGIASQAMSRIRIKKRKWLFFEVNDIDLTPAFSQSSGNMFNDNGGSRIPLQSANHGENLQRSFCSAHGKQRFTLSASLCP